MVVGKRGGGGGTLHGFVMFSLGGMDLPELQSLETTLGLVAACFGCKWWPRPYMPLISGRGTESR